MGRSHWTVVFGWEVTLNLLVSRVRPSGETRHAQILLHLEQKPLVIPASSPSELVALEVGD